MRVRKAEGLTAIEMWDVSEIMNCLNCDEMKAKRILEDYHQDAGSGYGPVEKALILDYIERKQREDREREARYKSDIANAESIAVLKEQVKVLKAMCESSSREAQSAKYWAMFASLLSVIATLAAAVLPWLLNHL